MPLQLKKSTPESQGVKSEAILKFIDRVEQSRTNEVEQDIHSLVMLRHGAVIAEGYWSPYESEMPHMLFSLSKSFTSTAIGFAVDEGYISVDDFVVSYFKDEVPCPSENLANMRIKHLLSMSTGHIVDTTDFFFQREDNNWVKAFFDVPVEKEPGTHFLYNTGATYILSVIITRVTGVKLIDYLRPRLFEPLGINNPTWETCPMGYNTGGFGLSITTKDIAKFGQLLLEKGFVDGKQLIAPSWVEEATKAHISNGDDPNSDWSQGYGYQFWRCRNNSYRGDGAFGQYCIVIPERDVVIAMTGGLADLQKPLNIIWEELLPGTMDNELPESVSYEKLVNKLSTLSVMLPVGRNTSNVTESIQNKCYKLDRNDMGFESVSFLFKPDLITMTCEVSGKRQVAKIGIGKWLDNNLQLSEISDCVRIASTWQDEKTLLVHCRLVETPFAWLLRFSFVSDKTILMETKINLAFEGTKWVSVEGTRV
ncbi:MAG: class beta-lactamase-related serine hydrolase [Anaerocolumna sp.]|jgi:CubicO group peptidase (beta-lactamase class C family)|nr:class beta-lactamase-related serine hydrolase [Anaerocolumna sp.]